MSAKAYFNAVLCRFLRIDDHRIDVPAENDRHGRVVLSRDRLAQIDDPSLDSAWKDALQALKDLFQLGLSFGLRLNRSS